MDELTRGAVLDELGCELRNLGLGNPWSLPPGENIRRAVSRQKEAETAPT